MSRSLSLPPFIKSFCFFSCCKDSVYLIKLRSLNVIIGLKSVILAFFQPKVTIYKLKSPFLVLFCMIFIGN